MYDVNVDEHSCDKLPIPTVQYKIVVLTVLPNNIIVYYNKVSAEYSSINVKNNVQCDNRVGQHRLFGASIHGSLIFYNA